MAKVKEYERRCQRCETKWYVPKKVRKEKAPSRMEIGGAKIQRAGALLTPGIGWLMAGSARRQVQALEDRRQRVIERDRCPSCGSASFDESKMW